MTDCFRDTATAKSSLALDQDAAQISNIYNTGIISSSNGFDITDVAFSTLFDNIKPCEYLSPNSFPAVCNNGQLFLLHLNIRSLAKNYDDLADFLSKFTIQPHVIALTKTKIKNRRKLRSKLESSFEKSCFRVRLQGTLCHNSFRALRKAVCPSNSL